MARESFTATTDLGLRTLSGGQLTIQVEGPLAIQTNAAPPLLVETAHSVRDMYAVVRTRPPARQLLCRSRRTGSRIASSQFRQGATVSNTVDGFALGPLQAQAKIGLDITSVMQTASATPGSDLTVTIRL